MSGWPGSPESLWEEELAVITQAIVYANLCNLGYCPIEFDMDQRVFASSVSIASESHNASDFLADSSLLSGEVEGITDTGVRFSYRDICRGYDQIFLGPFCVNMWNIVRTLSFEENPEMARFLALMHSLGPLLDPPSMMTFNGEERGFFLPSPERQEVQIRPPDDASSFSARSYFNFGNIMRSLRTFFIRLPPSPQPIPVDPSERLINPLTNPVINRSVQPASPQTEQAPQSNTQQQAQPAGASQPIPQAIQRGGGKR
jgi:hypothetical protein